MRPWTSEYVGRMEERIITSRALKDNPLGDEDSRPLWIYLPPGYDESPSRRYPTIYMLQGYSGWLQKWSFRPAFGRTVPERIDALFSDPTVPPCIVVYVDAWTLLGGSQFIDSPGTGNYSSYLCDDVVGFVDADYRTLPSPAYRGLQGLSSGGFGALVNAMLRPDVFGGLASHAGDTAYDLCYPSEIATAYRTLRDSYNGSVNDFFQKATLDGPSGPGEFSLMMIYALSACFSPTDHGDVVLPFSLEDGRIIEEVWQRWLAWDPVLMVASHAEALRSQRAIWIDAGRSDECFFDIGAERLLSELTRIGVSDVAFELFNGRHSGNAHRYPMAMRYLAERLCIGAENAL